MRIIGVIPSRFQSTRFPGKPLALISGKTLIERVWARAKLAKTLDEVIVATDHEGIAMEVESFGGKYVLTSEKCKSGTDRLAEVAKKAEKKSDIIINIQGDEPLISPALIDSLVKTLQNDDTLGAVTAAYPLTVEKDVQDPNIVKVVISDRSHALYFSRSTIPFNRSRIKTTVYKHLGIYGYRRDFLMKFSKWKPGTLESTEQLEQLRILEKGFPIKVVVAKEDSFGVDVPSDVRKIENILKSSAHSATRR